MKFLVAIFFFVFSISAASGKVYVTDRANATDLWIALTTNARVADCRILRSDITSDPITAEFWVYITAHVITADKWVKITDDRDAADPVSCLLDE